MARARQAPAPIETGPEPARRASAAPLLIAAVAGLLVIGLLINTALAPGGSTSGAGSANPAPGGAAVAVTAGAGAAGEQLQEAPVVGRLAPDFTVAGLNGGQITLSQYRGVKPVWLNFWATWCPPCRAEMPEMQKLYKTYQPQGVEFLGVDFREDQGQVKQFVGQGGFGWTFALDPNAAAARKYNVAGIPTHVFIGRDGVIKALIVAGLPQSLMVTDLNKILTP